MTNYTDDRVLADALADLGILLPNGNGRFRIEGYTWEELNDELAVHDWRVAGAVMERVCKEPCDVRLIGNEGEETEQITMGWVDDSFFCSVPTSCASMDAGATNESLPRAIIETGVRALTGEGE